MFAHLCCIHLRFVLIKAMQESLDGSESQHAPFRLPSPGIQHQYIDVFRFKGT
jgi:hypothetical protein